MLLKKVADKRLRDTWTLPRQNFKFLDEVLKYSASRSYIPGFEPSGVAISAVFTSLGIRLVT